MMEMLDRKARTRICSDMVLIGFRLKYAGVRQLLTSIELLSDFKIAV